MPDDSMRAIVSARVAAAEHAREQYRGLAVVWPHCAHGLRARRPVRRFRATPRLLVLAAHDRLQKRRRGSFDEIGAQQVGHKIGRAHV